MTTINETQWNSKINEQLKTKEFFSSFQAKTTQEWTINYVSQWSISSILLNKSNSTSRFTKLFQHLWSGILYANQRLLHSFLEYCVHHADDNVMFI